MREEAVKQAAEELAEKLKWAESHNKSLYDKIMHDRAVVFADFVQLYAEQGISVTEDYFYSYGLL